MASWTLIDSARAPDGEELELYERMGEHMIRAGGFELMSTLSHNSEEAFAEIALSGLGAASSVLIGGLGLGYTLISARRILDPSATIEVAELVEAILRWHEGPLAHLGAIGDPRLRFFIGDVGDRIASSSEAYDAILLDVDNGPAPVVRARNDALYSLSGLERARRALKKDGRLAVWSSFDDRSFEERLSRAGFEVSAHDVPARGFGRDVEHKIYLGRVATMSRTSADHEKP
jgi:spermidine synthase